VTSVMKKENEQAGGCGMGTDEGGILRVILWQRLEGGGMGSPGHLGSCEEDSKGGALPEGCLSILPN
jgi:hypothetical protein